MVTTEIGSRTQVILHKVSITQRNHFLLKFKKSYYFCGFIEGMMEDKTYSIRLPKYSLGTHQVEFTLNDHLMETFATSLAEHFNVHASLTLYKTNEFVQITYQLQGTVILLCDRCNLPFEFPIHSTNKVIYTFDSRNKNIDDDEVKYIPAHTDYLDLSQDLYDFICLQIPHRRVPEDCPRPECPTFEKPTLPDEEIDPRWEELLKLKNKEN